MGISSEMMTVMMREISSEYLLLQTQNPQIYESMLRYAKYIFPSVEKGLMTASRQELDIMSDFTGLDLQNEDIPVLKGVYKHLHSVPDKSARTDGVNEFITAVLGEYDALCVLVKI